MPAHCDPRHKDPRPPGGEGHRLGIHMAPALNKALDGQCSSCYYGQEALGVQAEKVNSKSESARQVTACVAGAPPWASGEPGVPQPSVSVGVGGAATPPPPDTWISLANQSAAPPCPRCWAQGWARDWPRPRKLYPGASSSPLCGLHTWVMSLQPQVAFAWAWEEGLPTDVDRQISAVQFGLLYLKKTCLHKPISCHHVYASLGWTLMLAAKRPDSLLGATAGLTQACP